MHCVTALFLGAAYPEIKSWRDPGGPVPLPDPSSAVLVRLFLGLLLIILLLSLASAWQARRDRKRKRERERRKLDEHLNRSNLTQVERALLKDIAREAFEPLDRVARLVLSFDKAVDSFLESLPCLPPEERLHLLRRLKTLRSKLSLDKVSAGVPLVSTREIDPGQEFLMRFKSDPAGRVLTGSLVALDDAGLSVRLDSSIFDGPSAARRRIEEIWKLSAAEGPSPLAGGGTSEDGGTERDIEVCFLRAHEGGYRFTSRVLSVNGEDPCDEEMMAQIAHPRRLAREQRRDYLRVPVYETILFARLPPDGQEEAEPAAGPPPSMEHTGTILDLSGGGFRLRFEGPPLRQDDRILLQSSFLPPPQDHEILPARAVHVYAEGAEYGFAFEGIPTPLVTAIIRRIEDVVRQARYGVELEEARGAR
jgi:c-di-GMP-binding flagellar brake protein YcgR